MSEKAEKKLDAKPEAEGGGEDKKKGGIGAMLGKLPVLLGTAMILEAIVLFAGFKFLGASPKPAEAAEIHGNAAGGHGEGGHGQAGGPIDPNERVELPVIEFRAPNKLTGRTLLFDVSIVVSVSKSNEEAVKKMLETRKALIMDRVRTIIAQSDPERLGGGVEPGLETLRRQVKYQLDEIVGHDMIEEVLVPRCIPFRVDL